LALLLEDITSSNWRLKTEGKIQGYATLVVGIPPSPQSIERDKDNYS
jgi:hypothetical protein